MPKKTKTKTVKITVDAEFKRFIMPLRQEEFIILEDSIIIHGCREPLVTWRGILIDGHHRLAICNKHGLKYKTVEMDFNDRDDVCVWIVKNQLGHRNLRSDAERVQVALKLKPILRKRAKAAHRAGSSRGGKARRRQVK